MSPATSRAPAHTAPACHIVRMPDDRLERILDAAYACFVRHGVRRTTMDDIAAAAEMSRPAVYQYVQNKDDAFRRLSTRLFDGALAKARAAAEAGPLAERLHGILAVKLELALRLTGESPHAEELLSAGARLHGDLVDAYVRSIRELATATVADAHDRGEITLVDAGPADIADIGIALTIGLEADLTNPDLLRRRLRQGIGLLVAGLSVPHAATQRG